MSLILAIESTGGPSSVALGEGTRIVFDSTELPAVGTSADVAEVLEFGLSVIERQTTDIRGVAVSVGPGALSAVRSGVSFANALAFGLGVPVYPIISFELMGLEASRGLRLPVLCSARAANGNAYLGLYDGGELASLRFGPLEALVRDMIVGLKEFIVAGAYRESIANLVKDANVHDTGTRSGKAAGFFEMSYSTDRRRKLYPNVAIPITECTIAMERGVHDVHSELAG